jgi:hypothetical protein
MLKVTVDISKPKGDMCILNDYEYLHVILDGPLKTPVVNVHGLKRQCSHVRTIINWNCRYWSR